MIRFPRDAEEVGLDLSYLETVAQHLSERGDHQLHSMLVARDGRLVFERYYNGYGPDNPHDIRSGSGSGLRDSVRGVRSSLFVLTERQRLDPRRAPKT